MKNKSTLDFYVVGAKKSGTTSLYYYFSEMPELCMHSCKELAFLSDGFAESGTFASVLDRYYKNADPKLLWGDVTPHYLYDPAIPEKLNNFMPGGRFIVILRDPVDRAVSNYHMMKSQGYETRGFTDVIQCQLEESVLLAQRRREFYHGADLDSYVVWGEYGRLLELFLGCIEKDRVMVIFLEELADDGVVVFDKLCNFLGVDYKQLPASLGTRYNDASKQNTLLHLVHDKIRNYGVAQKYLKSFIPAQMKQKLVYKYNLGGKAGLEKPTLGENIEQQLIDHYKPDVVKLQSMVGRPVPWSRFGSNEA